jgi:ABC-type sugar transport system ATPase subunit
MLLELYLYFLIHIYDEVLNSAQGQLHLKLLYLTHKQQTVGSLHSHIVFANDQQSQRRDFAHSNERAQSVLDSQDLYH